MVLNRYQRPEKKISGRKATLDPTSRDKSPPFLPNTNVDRRSHKPKRTSQLTTKKTAPRNGDIVAWLSGNTSKNLRLAWIATQAPKATMIAAKGIYETGLSDTENSSVFGKKISAIPAKGFEVEAECFPP
jgi:hypothetical protein